MSELICVSTAEKRVREHAAPLGSEKVPLYKATGRVLDEAIVSDRPLPPFDRVMMDGFVVRWDDWRNGTRSFRLEGDHAAGSPATELKGAVACLGVATGAVMPRGADIVLPVEWSNREGDQVHFFPSADTRVDLGLYIHAKGTDHVAGTVLVPRKTVLGPAEVAVAATCGHAKVLVVKLPKVALFGTGDELVSIETTPAPHQIRESNIHALGTACEADGLERPIAERLPDDPDALRGKINDARCQSDLLLFTGGVSKGAKDYLPGALAACGFVEVFHGVRQTPGKPLWFGRHASGALAFGLPGNPISAIVGYSRYVRIAIRELMGLPPERIRTVELAEPHEFKVPLVRFLPVRLEEMETGLAKAFPQAPKNSGDLVGPVGTDGFIQLPEKETIFPEGFRAQFYPW